MKDENRYEFGNKEEINEKVNIFDNETQRFLTYSTTVGSRFAGWRRGRSKTINDNKAALIGRTKTS